MKAALACAVAGLFFGITLVSVRAEMVADQITFPTTTEKIEDDRIGDDPLQANTGQSIGATLKSRKVNETANEGFAVNLAAGDKTAAETTSRHPEASFDRTLEFRGIRFRVTCANKGSINRLNIVPAGLEIDNSPIVRTIDGTVTGAEVADLNGDGSPEIYVYVTSVGSGSYGSLVAYSANRLKSLSEIYLPPLTQNKVLSKDYMGHDQFAVAGNRLVQRFSVYRDNDTNANPTGGTRQIQYKLVPGEAGWILQVDAVVEY